MEASRDHPFLAILACLFCPASECDCHVHMSPNASIFGERHTHFGDNCSKQGRCESTLKSTLPPWQRSQNANFGIWSKTILRSCENIFWIRVGFGKKKNSQRKAQTNILRIHKMNPQISQRENLTFCPITKSQITDSQLLYSQVHWFDYHLAFWYHRNNKKTSRPTVPELAKLVLLAEGVARVKRKKEPVCAIYHYSALIRREQSKMAAGSRNAQNSKAFSEGAIYITPSAVTEGKLVSSHLITLLAYSSQMAPQRNNSQWRVLEGGEMQLSLFDWINSCEV